jgi:membrane-bound serine protease (ClpP class)
MFAMHRFTRPLRTHINRIGRLTLRAWGPLALALLCSLGPTTAAASTAMVLTVNEAIGPASTDYIVRGLARAQEQGAALVVLEFNTPGGLDTAMRDIVQAILACPIPVATYVHPQGARAASAGTFILYASHIAAMAPATTLGAATPVAIGLPGMPQPGATEPADKTPSGAGEVPTSDAPNKTTVPLPGDTMKAKQVNDAAAFIRGLAQRHGRNAEWAERAVREAATLTAAEALRENVVDVVATNTADLLRQIDGKTVRMATGDLRLSTQGLQTQALPPDWRHRLLASITNPSLALILLMIGIYGLLIEFSSPGFGVAGIMGGICLLLALFALQMLPVNYAGLGLIVLGMLLLGAELLSPSFGVLGIGGVAAFVAGGILLFDRDVPGMGVPLPLILGLAASSAAVVFLGGGMALRARRAPVVSGREELLGAAGLVLEATPTEVWAQVHGERWAVSCETALEAGQRVRVKAVQGLTLQVMPIADRAQTEGENP